MPTKISFTNKEEQQLAGRLELPKQGTPRAFAIFAHCFTCTKNLSAIRHISKALNDQGIAVLRFDFTGLGDSEGAFEESNFSSNVTDLIAASNYLKANHEAPKLMIGHSLGGAAAIVAGSQIASIEAIATIGAPASPDHVTHLFSQDLATLEEDEATEVNIGGRPFKMKKQFIEDVSSQNMKQVFSTLRKAILIMHSPQDSTVEVDNAQQLYVMAHHPKSFISLDGADHLLSKKEDSQYVGAVIAQWASRYLSLKENIAQADSIASSHQVSLINRKGGYTTDIRAGKHTQIADEPTSLGGDDLGPDPYAYLLSSLGSCTAITMRMYANRKKWPIENIEVHLDFSRKKTVDQEGKEISTDHIDRHIKITGELDQKQLDRMMEIADRCPVHKTLHGAVKVSSVLTG